MTRTKQQSDRLTYWYLAGLNVCVLLMFAVLLFPRDDAPVLVATAIVPRAVLSETPSGARPVIGTARRVTVPSVGIDQQVRPGSYDTSSSSWTIDTSSTFHADVTVPVNNSNGTTLIYGHAGWGIFGKLPEIQPGAEADVYTEEGLRFMYVYESSYQVDPTDTSALTSSGPPRLLLQTCSGAFDAYRTLVTFRLKGVVRDE